MLINAEKRFVKTQWMVINIVAEFLEVPASNVRITRFTNHPELGLQIEGEYRKPRGRKWRAFTPLVRLHENHPYQNQQRTGITGENH